MASIADFYYRPFRCFFFFTTFSLFSFDLHFFYLINSIFLKIRNKSAAPIQITAEQLLREAAAHQVQPLRETEQQIMDQEELDEFRNRKRKEFENKIRKNKNNMSFWNKYANWEEIQGEIARYIVNNYFLNYFSLFLSLVLYFLPFSTMAYHNITLTTTIVYFSLS